MGEYTTICPNYWTYLAIEYSHHKSKGRMAMFSVRNLCGHIMVYDKTGKFLFSADNEREAMEELEEYEESAA